MRLSCLSAKSSLLHSMHSTLHCRQPCAYGLHAVQSTRMCRAACSLALHPAETPDGRTCARAHTHAYLRTHACSHTRTHVRTHARTRRHTRTHAQGYLSYPRTESSGYPPNSDLAATCALMRGHPLFGEYAASLLSRGVSTPQVCVFECVCVCVRVHVQPLLTCWHVACLQVLPGEVSPPSNPLPPLSLSLTHKYTQAHTHTYLQGGTNAGDHPPITPCASATEAELGGGDAWKIYDYVVRHFLG